MRSEVQVLLDPPHPSGQMLRGSVGGLSSVGRAPALQAGCRRFDSVRLHQTPALPGRIPSVAADPDLIGKHRDAFPSSRTHAAQGAAFTSFREIAALSAVPEWGNSSSSEETAALSKSSTLTKSLRSRRGGNRYMLCEEDGRFIPGSG